ncbi:NAD(+)/NADH kinase [Bellilinea sp.]|jgi:NAD+ kinase
MESSQLIPQRIAIGYHPFLVDAPQEAEQIARFLQGRGVQQVISAPMPDKAFRQQIRDGKFDLLIALGGDGTMLRAGHLGAQLGIPVLGINLGRFGFLMEVQRDEWRELLPRLLDGRYRLENRMMLRAEHLRGEQSLGCWSVLNEVVVCRGQFVRPVRLKASVDGYALATYIADGLIVATPTGSTAYALAVGGPILPPDLRNILIVAVAPHLSLDRAIILSEGSVVTVTVHTSHQAVMSVDGQAPITMEDGDAVRVDALPEMVRFVRFQDYGYFYRNLTAYMEQNPAAEDLS